MNDSEQTRRLACKISDFGFTNLSENAIGDNIVADVVFVHGLGGHPKHTWTYSHHKDVVHPRGTVNGDLKSHHSGFFKKKNLENLLQRSPESYLEKIAAGLG